MYDEVKEILKEYTAEEIRPESFLTTDLGLSSFDVVEIVCAFEERFGVAIPDCDLHRFASVKDIVAYLEERR